jgi:hypothetical protein
LPAILILLLLRLFSSWVDDPVTQARLADLLEFLIGYSRSDVVPLRFHKDEGLESDGPCFPTNLGST